MTNSLLVGYARLDATPMLGIRLAGYYRERRTDTILDPIEICAIAFASGETKVVALTMDVCYFPTKAANELRQHIAEVTGLPLEAVYLHPHPHRTPYAL